MQSIDAQAKCPCGSKQTFVDCCLPYLSGTAYPKTAQALMRSRYVAFVVGNFKYLADTYHLNTRHGFNDEKAAKDMSGIEWRSLRILASERGGENDDAGSVTFTASYQVEQQNYTLHERSRFSKHDGRWYYLDGDSNISHQAKKLSSIGRNDACPCGSGKKYKRCCGA